MINLRKKGLYQLMIPGLHGEDSGERERTPRRRAASVASTEVPETPLEAPYLREQHEPPRDRESSPSKKARVEDDAAMSPTSAAELVPVPDKAEEDEFMVDDMVDDVMLVDSSSST